MPADEPPFIPPEFDPVEAIRAHRDGRASGVSIDQWDDLRASLDKLVAELNAIPGMTATLAISVDVQITVTADEH